MAEKKKAKKKASKKKVSKKVEAKKGEEVKSEPAHVEEPSILVRGAGMGAKMMTQSEYDEWRKNR